MQQLEAITALLGEKLLEADCLKHEITALSYFADKDRRQQFLASIGVGLLIGAVIGCRLVLLAAK